MRNAWCGWVVAAVLTAAVGCDRKSGDNKADAGPTSQPAAALRVAVIPKGTTHAYWKGMEAGARTAAGELGVEMVWKGPVREDDRALQIDIVNQFVAEGINGIVLAPLDQVALARPVQAATAKGIPVAVVDSPLNGTPGKDYTSYIATDNRKAGDLGGERLATELGGHGKVVLLRYQSSSASTNDREAGFLDAIHRHPEITMLVDNRYAGATAGEAQQASQQLLDQLKQADGVFCVNESTTFGMLQALRQAGLAGHKTFVGFDASPQLIDGLKKGEIAALVVQNPRRMGYEAVKAVVAKAKGQTPAAVVDTGATLVDKANLDAPSVKPLVAAE